MRITKSFLKHEIQNILMILACHLEEGKIKNKKEILGLIKMISLFTEHEDLLLGKKPEFYFQNVFLSDLIEIMLNSNAEIIKRNKIRVEVGEIKPEIFLKIERDSALRALNQIFYRILNNSVFVKLNFETNEKRLTMDYNEEINLFKEKELEQVLKEDKNNYREIALQISFKILREMGISLEFGKENLTFFFPKI